MCLSRGVAPSDELSVLICAFSCHLSSKKDPSATQILTVETVAFSPSSASTERAEKKGTACRNTNGNGLFSSFGVLVENLLAPVIITQVSFSDKRPVRDPRHGAWAALDSLCGRRTKLGKTCWFSTSGASFAARIQYGLCSVRKIWARLSPGEEQRIRIGRTCQSFPECKLHSWGKKSVLPPPETETDISCEIPESYSS